jgi:O-antigen/teichoic acid export membrane protein
MNKPLSLRKNFAWSFVGSTILSGTQWGMLMTLTKLASPVEVGCYTLSLAITAPVVQFSMLQLRAIQATDAQNLNEFKDFLGVRIITNIAAMILILGILVGLRKEYSFRVYVLILIVGITKVIQSTSDVAYGLMQKYERLDKVSQSMILYGLGGFIFYFAVLKITGDQIPASLSLGLLWLLILLFFDKQNVDKLDRFSPRFRLKKIVSILWLGAPLGVVMGILSLNANMSRYFVEGFLGSEKLGYFGAMAYVVVGASQMVNALGQAVSPRLAKYFYSNRRAYVMLMFKSLCVALALAISVVLFAIYFGKSFLSLVYTPEYAKNHDVFIWLMVVSGSTMLASILGYGMTATRRFKSQVPLFSLTCLVSLLSSWLLTSRYLMKGAVWAMLIGVVVQGLGSIVIILIALRSPPIKTTSDLV